LLKETARLGQRDAGHRPKKIGSGRATQSVPKLKDLGISKDQSSRYQKMAEIPDEKFEKLVREPGTSSEEILRRAGKTKAVDIPSPETIFDSRALWSSAPIDRR